jgi:hypothetical protein
MAVSFERTHAHSRCSYNFVTVPLPQRLQLRLRDGRFTSETATWIQKFSKNPLGLLEKNSIDMTVFQGGGDGRGYGGFRFGPDMSTSGLLPFKMASEKTIEEPGV